MMRASILLAGIVAVNAGPDLAKCSIDGLRAADDMLDSAVFIWAAVQRCDKTKPAADADPIRCSLNIASTIESVNAMVNVVLKAVEQCGGFEKRHEKCGLAVGVLTKAFAGLAAGSSGVVARCPNALNNFKPLETVGGPSGSFANPGVHPNNALSNAAGPLGLTYCLVNVKDSIKTIFKAMKRVLTIKKHCEKPGRECAENSLKLAAALGSIGEFTAGAIGKCSGDVKLAENGECAQEALAIVSHLNNVGKASAEVSDYCKADAARLYELENGEMPTSSGGNAMTLVLGAFLPLTAVVSFVGGSRFARTSQVASYTATSTTASI